MTYQEFIESPENFFKIKELPVEERKSILTQFVQDKEYSSKSMICNSNLQKSTSIYDIAQDVGIEECVNFLNELIEDSSGVSGVIKGNDVKEAFERINAGEGTDKDYAIAKMFEDSLLEENTMIFRKRLVTDTLQTIREANDAGCYPMLTDLVSAFSVFTVESMISIENCELSKYKHVPIEMVYEISKQVGNDIYETWKNTLDPSVTVDNSIVLAGVLWLASKIATGSNYKIPTVDSIKKAFSDTNYDEDTCDCDGDCDCKDESDACDCGCCKCKEKDSKENEEQ